MAEDKVVVEGPRSPTRGAQVRLEGDAAEAARGGLGADIEGNTVAKKAMEADGTVPDGYTPDGTTRSGKPPPEAVVTTAGEAGGEMPAKTGTTRVEVAEPAPADQGPTPKPPLGAPEPKK